MYTKRSHQSIARLLGLAGLFILSAGALCSAHGQPDANLRIATTYRVKPTSNPEVRLNHIPAKGPDNRSKQPSKRGPESPAKATLDEKQQEIEKWISRGNEARDAKEYERALASYRKVQELNPKEVRAYYGLGNVYADLFRTDSAIENYLLALKLNPQEFAAYYGLGNVYASLYCADAAIESYLTAVKLKKDYLDGFLALGYAFVGKERYDDAENQFLAALKLAPDNAGAKIALSSVYARKGKNQEAIEQLDFLINNSSIATRDRASAHVALGQIFSRQEKRQEEIVQYEKAITLSPDLALAYLFLGSAQASSTYHDLIGRGYNGMQEVPTQELAVFSEAAKKAGANLERAREHGYNHPNLFEFMSYALVYQGRYQDARAKIKDYFAKVKELEQQVAKAPLKCDAGFDRLNAEGHWHVGWAYFIEADFQADTQRKTELYSKAYEELIQAIKLKEDYAGAYWTLGNVSLSQQKYNEAITQYQNAIRYDVGEFYKASLYDAIGSAYSSLGRYPEAIENTQKAISLNPRNPTYYEGLASISVKQGKLDETFIWLKKANEVRTTPPTNPSPYYYLGVTYAIRFIQKRDEADFAEALKWLKKALEIRASYPLAYSALGIVYENHANADLALASYEKAIEYDLKNPAHYFHLADVYLNLMHNDDAAIERLGKVIEIKPDSAEAYWRLAQVFRHKQNNTEAIKQLSQAIKIDPNYLDAFIDLGVISRARKDYPEAMRYLNQAIKIAPTNFQPYKEVAKVYEDQSKNEEAAHYYEESMIRLKSDDVPTRNLYLGRIARLRGQYADAIGYFQKIGAIFGPGQAPFEIGVTYVVSRNKKAAFEQYQQLLQLKSPYAEDLLKKIDEMK